MIPAWLQTFAALSLVFLTAWTLIVLRRYAGDTRKIADSGVEQTENAQIPFLALALKEPPVGDDYSPRGWALENQGFGPALNIRHSEPGGNEGWVENVNPIKGGDFSLIRNFDAGVMQQQVFIAEYESLSGTKYRTVIEWRDGVKQTRFGKG